MNRDDEGCRVTNAGRANDLPATGRPAMPTAADEGVGGRRELLGVLRRIAVHLETAQVLELRADRSASPSLAVVLRERAAQRRRIAGRLRTGLDGTTRETIRRRDGGESGSLTTVAEREETAVPVAGRPVGPPSSAGPPSPRAGGPRRSDEGRRPTPSIAQS